MKILHINWSGDFGGAENIAHLIAKEQAKKGNDVTIAYLTEKLVYGDLLKEKKTLFMIIIIKIVQWKILLKIFQSSVKWVFKVEKKV